MSYFSYVEDKPLSGWLGCGAECNCRRCGSAVSGLNEWYEKEEDGPAAQPTPGSSPPSPPLSGWTRSGLGFGFYGSPDVRFFAEVPGSNPAMPNVTAAMVSKMFPGTPVTNIQTNLPFVLKALADAGLGDKEMILMALATIRAETGNFTPLSEFKSRFNTPPGGAPFSLYDNRRDLGNQGPPDGANYRGRGYIQLTGRSNYRIHGAAIGLGNQLVTNPGLANQPDIAAKLLASFLKSKEQAIRNALRAGNLAQARRLVNGGSHGLPEFTAAYNIGRSLIA